MTTVDRAARGTARRDLVPGLVLALVAALAPSGTAQADAWYVGVGSGISRLVPDAENGLDTDETASVAGTLFLGRDLDDRTGVQMQLHALGTATFEDDREADYYAADASVLYRFFDARDRTRSAAGVALYGRFSLGFMERDTGVALEDDAPVWFGAGTGLEFALNRRLALRAEGLYVDTDAGAAHLAVVGRFGGIDRPTAPAPSPAPAPQAPEPSSAPAPATTDPAIAAPEGTDTDALIEGLERRGAGRPTADDADGDGVLDAADVCPRSTPGYPVRDNGCALFDGVLSGVRFLDGSAELRDGATEQLDALARVLAAWPDARIELHAHTDTRGDARDQAIVTRARLRTIGTYLVERGIAANRLVLRSFGGSRPLDAADATVEDANRIEVIENTR